MHPSFMFPTISRGHSHNEFVEYALAVRAWFLKFPKLSLTPLGLEQMTSNHIVLTPASRDPEDLLFYSSVFHCTLCNLQTPQIREIQNHCSDFGHQKRLYRIYRESVKQDKTSASHRLIDLQSGLSSQLKDDDSSLQHSNSHDACPDARLKTLPAMHGFKCEQCAVVTTDPDLFLLHLKGFGHSRRQMESRGPGLCQPMRDTESGSIFYFQPSTNSVFDDIQPVYPGERHSVCEFARKYLTEFIHFS